MRLTEALKDDHATYVFAEATLARLGLTDEAAMIATDRDHRLCEIAVACDKALVVFSLEGAGRLGASVRSWHDVSPPILTALTEEKLETILMKVNLLMTRPPLDIGTAEFRLGNVEWRMDSTDAVIEFWRVCAEHAVAPR